MEILLERTRRSSWRVDWMREIRIYAHIRAYMGIFAHICANMSKYAYISASFHISRIHMAIPSIDPRWLRGGHLYIYIYMRRCASRILAHGHPKSILYNVERSNWKSYFLAEGLPSNLLIAKVDLIWERLADAKREAVQ